MFRIRIRPLTKLMDLNDVFDRFWRKLTKKDSVDSAKYEITIFLPVLSVFGHFFPWIRIFRIVSGFLSDPDPDSGKQVPSGSGKKTRIRNTEK